MTGNANFRNAVNVATPQNAPSHKMALHGLLGVWRTEIAEGLRSPACATEFLVIPESGPIRVVGWHQRVNGTRPKMPPQSMDRPPVMPEIMS